MSDVFQTTFKGHPFKFTWGGIHYSYSVDTFMVEEVNFRNNYWDVKAGDVVFDVGSSYGSYTLPACAVGATVYAFEPEKGVYGTLVNNIALNDWRGTRCFPANYGLYSSSSKINMKEYAPHWPAETITSDYDVRTIDEVVYERNIQHLDWMKIDVEGVEDHVIQGGLRSIERFRPNIIVECHDFLDPTLSSKVKDLLIPFNYVFEDVPRHPCVMVVAKQAK